MPFPNVPHFGFVPDRAFRNKRGMSCGIAVSGVSTLEISGFLRARPRSTVFRPFVKAWWKHRRGAEFIYRPCVMHVVVAPSIWQPIPGRHGGLYIEVWPEIGNIFYRLAMVPVSAWHAVGLLARPLGAILLRPWLTCKEPFGLTSQVIVLAALSGLFVVFALWMHAVGVT